MLPLLITSSSEVILENEKNGVATAWKERESSATMVAGMMNRIRYYLLFRGKVPKAPIMPQLYTIVFIEIFCH